MGSPPCLGTWKNPIGMGLKKMGWVAIRVISPWAGATQMYQFEGPTESGTDLKLVRR